jgi:hypothetical protein
VKIGLKIFSNRALRFSPNITAIFTSKFGKPFYSPLTISSSLSSLFFLPLSNSTHPLSLPLPNPTSLLLLPQVYFYFHPSRSTANPSSSASSCVLSPSTDAFSRLPTQKPPAFPSVNKMAGPAKKRVQKEQKPSNGSSSDNKHSEGTSGKVLSSPPSEHQRSLTRFDGNVDPSETRISPSALRNISDAIGISAWAAVQHVIKTLQ